jgi:hypothetical protein
MNSDNYYEGVHIIIKKPKPMGTDIENKYEFELKDDLEHVHTISLLLVLDSPEKAELFKMLVSKYVSLHNEGAENYSLDKPPYTPISNEMKLVAEELKKDLQRYAQHRLSMDPDLLRMSQLMFNVVQDIENQLNDLISR